MTEEMQQLLCDLHLELLEKGEEDEAWQKCTVQTKWNKVVRAVAWEEICGLLMKHNQGRVLRARYRNIQPSGLRFPTCVLSDSQVSLGLIFIALLAF